MATMSSAPSASMETDVNMPPRVTNDITALLLDRHGITDPTKSDFQITSVEALLASRKLYYRRVDPAAGRDCAISPCSSAASA